ncbi:MAG: signal recognition particle-docking protein FtsY [Pseudomonadota bacterium]
MSFFNRLKQRLWKSSSALDEGVEALMESGEIEADAAAPAPAKEAPEQRPSAPNAAVDAPAANPAQGAAPQEPAPQEPAPQEPAPQEPAPQEPAPQEPAFNTPSEEQAPSRSGFAARMLAAVGVGGAAEKKRVLDDEMLEELEELLIATDLGVETAMRVAGNVAAGRFGRRIGGAELKRLLADEIAAILAPVAKPLPLYAKRPQVVLVVGVNGSGKTTTIGKVASQLKAAGKSVMIAAGDTFRAAAVEQLQIWGDRADVPVFRLPQGSDPASLAFDAMTEAEAKGADVLLVDTAGRLQNRQDLMEELAKIVRVIRKKDPEAPHNTVLVLDATTGQNAIAQVEIFTKIADVSGLIMTKLDGTARGGVLVALADKTGLPIHAIGVGEAIEDLSPFEPEDFAVALTGLER